MEDFELREVTHDSSRPCRSPLPHLEVRHDVDDEVEPPDVCDLLPPTNKDYAKTCTSPGSATTPVRTVFRACVDADFVDIDELRDMVWHQGIADGPWARPLAWKLLLQYLPPERNDWKATLEAKRAWYRSIMERVTRDPSQVMDSLHKTDQSDAISSQEPASDHPLSNSPGSVWAEHFRGERIRNDIRRDVKRTHPEIHRFRGEAEERLIRILFVWCRIHPDYPYCQGMSEILAPVYFVMSESPFEELDNIEAGAFVNGNGNRQNK